MIELRESLTFGLESLLGGGDGLVARRHWVALAPHLGVEVGLDADDCELLGRIAVHDWSDVPAGVDPTRLQQLVEQGLVFREGDAPSPALARDAALRALHWHPLAAVAHVFSRWSGVDSAEEMDRNGLRTVSDLVRVLGPPPPHFLQRDDAGTEVPLPKPEPTPLSQLMAGRATCRNFDVARDLPQVLLGQVLHRVFAAQAVVEAAPGASIVKKLSPAGGGLHAIEAFVLVQRVEGMAPGLHHYHPGRHTLEPLEACTARAGDLAALALRMLAGQYWFAPAHVVVVLAPRFARSHWKYRGHSKAYRALLLDAGHLSQTLYLAATECGLGAFVTAAVNEAEIEAAFALDALADGPVAVCGFGWRAPVCSTMEFDPLQRIWPERAPVE